MCWEVMDCCHDLGWPPELMKKIFFLLYEKDIVFEDGFKCWRDKLREMKPVKKRALIEVYRLLCVARDRRRRWCKRGRRARARCRGGRRARRRRARALGVRRKQASGGWSVRQNKAMPTPSTNALKAAMDRMETTPAHDQEATYDTALLHFRRAAPLPPLKAQLECGRCMIARIRGDLSDSFKPTNRSGARVLAGGGRPTRGHRNSLRRDCTCRYDRDWARSFATILRRPRPLLFDAARRGMADSDEMGLLHYIKRRRHSQELPRQGAGASRRPVREDVS